MESNGTKIWKEGVLLGKSHLIFAVLGTCPYQFTRLVDIIDEYAAEQDCDIFVQLGYTQKKPVNCQYVAFLSRAGYLEKMSCADLIIAHAGIGVTLDAAKLKKRLLLVPRTMKLNEHTNDHQFELAMALESEGKAIVADDSVDGPGFSLLVEKAFSIRDLTWGNTKENLIKRLSEYLESLAKVSK